jgi:Zn-dependent peptidase ImmA (M78 family)
MTALPVKGAVLEWARTFRGLAEGEAAERLGITVGELRQYEAGTLPVTIGVFENFAAKYRLPQATLFRLTKPQEPPKPQDFRTIEGRRPRESFEFSVALSNVRTWLSQYDRITADDDEFETPNLPLISISGRAEIIGEKERRRLEISPQAQLAWPAKEAFRRWRASFETHGINIFQQKFPLDDCKGFTLYEAKSAPTIVINKSEDFDVAKIFTLAHEYCHLLLRKPGLCNKFAAAFLIPTDAIRLLLPHWPNKPVAWKREQIDEWAIRLKVSRIALALRLEQLGIAPEGFHVRFKLRQRTRQHRLTDGHPDPTVTHLSDIGGNYTQNIMDALDRKVIDEIHASEALGVGVQNFEKARAAIRRYRELAIGG